MTNESVKSEKAAGSGARDSLLKQRLRQRSREAGHDTTAFAAAPAPTDPIELSPFQRPLWVDYRMYPERRTSWIIRGYLLEGALDEDRLVDALSQMKNRHWYLCCAIDVDGMVHPREAAIPLEVTSTPADPWQEAQDYCRNRFEPFRLEQGKLFRVHVFQGEQSVALVVAIHHILADHQSVDVLTSELSALYEDDEAALSPAADLVSAYERQRSDLETRRPALQQFWKSRLHKLPAATPLPLAGTHSDPVKRKGSLIRASAETGLAEKCRDAAAEAGVSLYQWLLAAWTVLLARYYDRDDVHLGTMFSTRIGAQQKDALGCFQNVLIVRPELETTVTFADVLGETRSVVGNAIAHGGMPLDELARLAPIHPGSGQLFSTLFTLVATEPQPQLMSRDVLRVEELDYAGTAFDLTFFVITAEDGLSFAVEFDTAVYDGGALTVLFDSYQALLARLAADIDTDWRRCSLVGAAELEALGAECRRISDTPLPTDQLHDAFYRHAATQPDSPALQWNSGDGLQQLSYGELAARADAIAGYIDAVAETDDSTVAVLGGWNSDTAAALIGILRSGRAYLPVDVNYPPARIEHILGDAGRPLLLLQPGAQAPDGFADRCHGIADAVRSESEPGPCTDSNAVAYVIYTSGSSGAPKGVRVSHAAAAYSTQERNRVYANRLPERFLLLSSFAFDSAVAGFWWSLSNGASLRLVDREVARAADAVAELIVGEAITHTLCLPGQWSDICRISRQPLTSMKLVVVAGEACATSTVKQHFEQAPQAALYNEYGPTEMTVWSTFQALAQDASDPVPIGRPLSLTQAIVTDAHGNPVPRGLPGELLLAGHGIAAGYVGDANGGFVSHPLNAEARAYRTGDRARLGVDGLIYYLGRIDEQVKYRGYRIGIENIEHTLSPDGAGISVVPWDGTHLEDLLADLPDDQAHALVDKYLDEEN